MSAAGRYRRIMLYLLMLLPATVCVPLGLAAAIEANVGAAFLAAPLMTSGMVVLYLGAHCLRGVRLALLSATGYDISARTTFLLHLFTAPLALIPPFKLGEIFRFQQLMMVTRKPLSAFVILLLDRVLDVVVLLPAFLYVILTDKSGVSADTLGLVGLLSVVLICAGAVFLVAPEALRTAQRYVFLRHARPRARLVLEWLSATGDILDQSVRNLRANFAILIALSLAIWSLEVGATFLLLGLESARTIVDATLAVLERAMFDWRAPFPFAPPSSTAVRFSTFGFVALLLPWPFVAVLYVRRVNHYYLADLDKGQPRRRGQRHLRARP